MESFYLFSFLPSFLKASSIQILPAKNPWSFLKVQASPMNPQSLRWSWVRDSQGDCYPKQALRLDVEIPDTLGPTGESGNLIGICRP